MDTISARILVRRDTVDNWNANRSFIPLRGEIIVYTDYGKVYDELGNEVNIPWVKIGDGNAYLIDLPFVGDDVRFQILHALRNHTDDTEVHITQQEREFWNNKLNCKVSDGVLILNRQ